MPTILSMRPHETLNLSPSDALEAMRDKVASATKLVVVAYYAGNGDIQVYGAGNSLIETHGMLAMASAHLAELSEG